MVANCIKVATDVYTPPSGGDPIPMVIAYLDVEGMSDIVKVQLAASKVDGKPAPGEVYVDCRPRYGSGGRMYWKPSQIKFP